MSSSLRIVVTGLVAQYPLGGVAWDYAQFPAGLLGLGHDVFYLEDTGQWPFNPAEGGTGRDPDFNVRYLARTMERFGLQGRWAYRFPWKEQWFGMSDARRREVLETADLLLNVSGALRDPEGYRELVDRLAYIDSDPVFTQVKLARGQSDFERSVEAHDVHFSFGELLADPEFAGPVPAARVSWLPTRQPILLDEWVSAGPPGGTFTTVMNWTSYKPLVHEGRSYGQKDVEMERFLDLPSRVAPTILELAVAAGKTGRTPYDLLRHKGWRVVDPDRVCPGPETYRRYLQGSKAEWGVAKQGYVVGATGWFSCRSACYLAAGRPVVVQDTGFGELLPVGEGLLAFRTVEEAAEGIRRVEADYDRHSRAALDIARAYFDSDLVLGSLVERSLTSDG